MSKLQNQVKAASLKALLLHELKDLYDAEHQILEALPLMIDHAKNKELKDAFENHLTETENHITRLEDCFEALGSEAEREACAGMAGLIKEGEHVMKGDMPDDVLDAALIGAAQRVEHYEIAGYGTAKAHAAEIDEEDVVDLLQEILTEEIYADKTLTKIAESKANKAAVNG